MTLTKPRSRAQEAQIDMTEGSIVKKLIKFTLPILVGNLFQQLYNMVDTFVIGQTGIDDAYAAVGSVAPVINILIGFFLGLSSGAGVVISQYFGAKNEEGVRRAAHTSIAITLVMGVFITIAGVLFTPLMVELMLGEDGSVLSAGQIQLLCIARVMLALPPMLILDEATSSIDTRTEIKIQDAFAEMMRGRTSFIVAHRLNTIKNADKILVMKDGKIVEQGRHDELMAKNGFYASLYGAQFKMIN